MTSEWTPERLEAYFAKQKERKRIVQAHLRHEGFGTPAWRRFSRSIFEERGGRCEECNALLGKDGRRWALHAKNGDHKNLDPTNFLLLCGECHGTLTQLGWRALKRKRKGGRSD